MRIAGVLSVAFFAALFPAGAAAANAIARLSNDAAPVSYDLHIQPVPGPNDNWYTGPGGLKVLGTETIVVQTARDLDAIVMNQSHIEVHKASIDGETATSTIDQTLQQLRLQTAHRLAAGRHTVELAFTATSPNPGFQTYGGDARVLATLFEESLARGSFPCFDEPQFRARFTLHVRVPSAWTVVSNMPESARRPEADGTDVHDFAPTPPMPVYLLTFDMGVLAHVDGSAETVPVRVFVRPGKEAQARVMLADAERLLPYYEAFFATPYPLPKLDFVVVPDFEDTALEGWGAITSYSEEDAFGDQMGGGVDGRREAVEVVAHEMAHQWVGDLVDMAWWRDTFVAEGLAEFSQQRAMATLFPELTSWASDDRQLEFILDGGVGPKTKPVVSPVATDLDEDDGVPFGGATYLKGATIVRQWQRLIGEPAFKTAIASYLAAHAYGSATFEDFWSAFSDPRAPAYGDAWFKHFGFPLVTIDVECIGGRSSVELDQQPYVSDPHVAASYRRQRWPMLLEIDVAGKNHAVLASAVARNSFDFPGCGIVSIDSDFRPYARVRYSGDAAAALGVRPLRERERVFRDYAAMREDGYLDVRDYLEAVASPRAFDGIELDVVGTTAVQLDEIHDVLRGSPLAPSIVEAERTLIIPTMANRSFDEYASSFDSRGIGRSLLALANGGDLTLSETARVLYFKDATSPKLAPLNSQYGIASLAGVGAGKPDVDRVEALLRSDKLGGTGPLFLEHVRDEALVPGILDAARREPRVAGGTFADFLFATGTMHPKIAYAYLQSHLHDILAAVAPAQRASVIADGSAASLWSAVPAEALVRFLKQTFPDNRVTVARAAAEIERHWSERRALERELIAR
jgi:aminopeptidase N